MTEALDDAIERLEEVTSISAADAACFALVYNEGRHDEVKVPDGAVIRGVLNSIHGVKLFSKDPPDL